MKILILGGSFNPPHKGHIHISLCAAKKLGLKKVWWVVARQNPLKAESADFIQRFRACEEITKNYQNIEIKDFEVPGSPLFPGVGPIYSAELLQKITKKFPRQEFYWLMGADNLTNFDKWHNWQEIIKKYPTIIFGRKSCLIKAKKSKAAIFAQKFVGKNIGIRFLHMKKSPFSSTAIRNKNSQKNAK